jgi:hypothetical protein
MWFGSGKGFFFNQGESEGTIVARRERAWSLTDTTSAIDRARQSATSKAAHLSKDQVSAYIRGYVAGYEHAHQEIWRHTHW